MKPNRKGVEVSMSGHSKWHNIKLRKGKQDAERGKAFTRLAREIIVAAKSGGGNPDMNPRLRLTIQKAREASMPADNIKRAIQRGTGEVEGANYEELTYEGYGPGGTAVLVSSLTDNKNRTVSEMRYIFSRNGGNLGESGCVAWNFEPKGVISIDANGTDEDTVMMQVLDAGAEDITTADGAYEVVTAPEDYNKVDEVLRASGLKILESEYTMVPKNTVKLVGKEAQQMLRLVDALEESDDVQKVYANFDIPDEVLEEIMGE
jgi:YebC/PmpR family DNA-binding regulatory protein